MSQQTEVNVNRALRQDLHTGNASDPLRLSPTAEHREMPTVELKTQTKARCCLLPFPRVDWHWKGSGTKQLCLGALCWWLPLQCRLRVLYFKARQKCGGAQIATAPMGRTNHLLLYCVVIHRGHTVRKREIRAGRQLSWTLAPEPTNPVLGKSLIVLANETWYLETGKKMLAIILVCPNKILQAG